MVTSRIGAPEIRDGQERIGQRQEDMDEAAATERTGLLSNGDSQGQDARKDSWIGFEEFAGLPWYKTPSVSSRGNPDFDFPNRCALQGLTACARFTGCSARMPSSAWHLAVL
jgi:hypothetical protein